MKLLCDTSKNTRMSEQLQNKGSTYSSINIRPSVLVWLTTSTFALHKVVTGVSSRVPSLYDESKEGLHGRLLISDQILLKPVGKEIIYCLACQL